ncbi:Protein trapped in endoderm-1 [Pseudolycoriella hygida]|uniref:Protein trapped in endoderm-1 n=1 Tax=Pseudolycoriella hygida TaxID=35572 RepID=A0A9Q0S1T4_9DIPT|nr:Protein trapped in endoderm-1 [Pseudolycoriella hygida]
MESTTTVVAYSNAAIQFAATCACIFAVVGTLGNSVTACAILRKPKLRRHPISAFVLSLCFSDLLFCSIVLPLSASRYICKAWIFGDALCKLFAVITYSTVAISLLSLIGILLNRFSLFRCYKYYTSLYSRWSVVVQLLIIWVSSISFMLPPLLGVWGELGLKESTFSCTILKKDGESIKPLLFVCGFFLPCIFIIFCYLSIYCVVRRKDHKFDRDDDFKKSSESCCGRGDARFTSMITIVFASFLICFLPLTITNVIDEDERYPWITILTSVLAWASRVANPFIYAATNKVYRKAYRQLLATCHLVGPLLPRKGRNESSAV